MLKAWERESAKVQTLRCKLVLWEYDTVFNKKTVREGELKYKAPDHGLYRMQDAAGRNWVEHWMCDGQAIYQYNYAEKKLVQRNVPPELRGKAIADGPLPFLFGADANKLLARYYMRVVTPENSLQDQVWIEAYPKKQADAANFQRATVILRRQDLVPFAIELYMPNGKTRTVHQFDSPVVNEKWSLELLKGDPFAPYVPRGWTKIIDPEIVQGPPRGPQRITPPMRATNPAAAPRR